MLQFQKYAPRGWPLLAIALAAGLLEWAALSRSRLRDTWSGARHRVSHR